MGTSGSRKQTTTKRPSNPGATRGGSRKSGSPTSRKTKAGSAGRKAKRPKSKGKERAGSFLIVGVGASAGGLEAFDDLIRGIGSDGSLAIVLIQHVSPKHPSNLAEIIRRATPLEVVQIQGPTKVEPGHVYVIPPDSTMTISGGVLHLERREGSALPLPIDRFFRSLAADQGSGAVAVVLSGSGSDGSLGIQEVKEHGGITFAQDDSAKHRSMPEAAIAAGAVDFVFPAGRIGEELTRLAGHRSFRNGSEPRDGGAFSSEDEDPLKRLFALLQVSRAVDFTHYKPSTVGRRIRRRMAVHRIDSLGDYLSHVRQHPEELDQLYQDMLIRVTSFFRDANVFEHLKKEILPSILEKRADDQSVRVWVPGCSTGEEAYSIAIVLLELIAQGDRTIPLQVFGTDVSEAAIDRARAGVFPETIAEDVSPERLRTFFTRESGGYRIRRTVRDCCVFARQDLTKDPPFSRIDLISCRNVLIYLEPVLQRRVLGVFSYAMRPDGRLLLGSSESVNAAAGLFDVVDRKHNVFRKRPGVQRPPVQLGGPVAPALGEERPATPQEEMPPEGEILQKADQLVLEQFAPPGALVNEALEIVQLRGRTSEFLQLPAGAPSFSILRMAREGLLSELRAGLLRARRRDEPVRREGVRLSGNGDAVQLTLHVLPVMAPGVARHFLVLFEKNEPTPGTKRGKRGERAPEPDQREVRRLQKELEATREYLQSTIEEQETMNEELRSANEETQSSNEELQSTNEELETAKEELESSNEELTTLNDEMENRNTELDRLNNDLLNLLAAIDVPVVILENDLRIRRFNTVAQEVLNLIPADVGRPMRDMNLGLGTADVEALAAKVIETLEIHELMVEDRDGRTWHLRLRPYRTTDHRIDGVVVTMIEASRTAHRKKK